MTVERNPEAKRVMLVEDDGSVIRSVRVAIEEDPQLHFVGYLTGRANLDRFLDEHAPDVALVDLGLMRAKGSLHVTQEQDFEEALWIITRINEHSPYTKIMGFSNYFITEPARRNRRLIMAHMPSLPNRMDRPNGRRGSNGFAHSCTPC